jgi:hypothetical protein
MKKKYFLFTFLVLSFVSFAQNVTITKIIETDCSSPFVKSVELYVDGTVNFATNVILNYMKNGAAWGAEQIDVSGFGTISDKFIYIVRDLALMQTEFPGTTFDASNTIVEESISTNGDDGYQVVLNGNIVSQFGVDSEDGTDTAWEHGDAFAERNTGTTDTGSFSIEDWTFSALDFLDPYGICTKTTTGINGALLETVITLGNWASVLSNKEFSKLELSIYPNPVKNGLLTIKSPLLGAKNVALFDAIGRNILKIKLTSEALDVSQLGAGLYLLKVTIGDRSVTQKLVIN